MDLRIDSREQVVLASAIAAVPILWYIGGKALDRYLTGKYTVVYDIANAAKPREEGKRLKSTAVICGGSVAGLFSARICANHFDEVIIIEPEVWTSTEGASTPIYNEKGAVIDPSRFYKRKRIEQYESIHAFLPVTLEATKALFPGFDEEMIAGDGRILKDSIVMQHRDGRVFRRGSPYYVLFASRELFERTLRREVMKDSRIKHVTGTATGAKASEKDLCRLESVRARLTDGSEKDFPAELVLDCTGPTQAGYKWLKRLYSNSSTTPQISKSIPFEDLRIEYNANIVARKWRAPITPEMRERLSKVVSFDTRGYDGLGWVYSYLGQAGQDYRSFGMTRIEGHRFEIVCRARAEANYEPPATPDDIIPFVHGVSSLHKVEPWVFDLIEIVLTNKDDWEDLGSEGRMAFSCVRYERAPILPHNFVAVGDSWMRVNPVYGQGLSKAAASAVILDSLLRKRDVNGAIPDGFSRRYANVHARQMKSVWTNNKIGDYQWETTVPCKGEDRLAYLPRGKQLDLVLELCVRDDYIDRAVTGIRSFLRPPTDLFHPKVLAKIMWFSLQKKLGLA